MLVLNGNYHKNEKSLFYALGTVCCIAIDSESVNNLVYIALTNTRQINSDVDATVRVPMVPENNNSKLMAVCLRILKTIKGKNHVLFSYLHDIH